MTAFDFFPDSLHAITATLQIRLAGYPPFYDDNPLGIYHKIMDGYYEFPPHIEPKARDLVKSFLCADTNIRLGAPKVSLINHNNLTFE